MTYRKSRDETQRRIRWNEFVRGFNTLFLESGAPAWAYATLERFDAFLS